MQIPRRQSGCVSVPQQVRGGGKTTAAALLNESCCTAKKELEPHQAELGMALALAVTTGSQWSLVRSSFSCAEHALGDASPCHLHGAMSGKQGAMALSRSC